MCSLSTAIHLLLIWCSMRWMHQSFETGLYRMYIFYHVKSSKNRNFDKGYTCVQQASSLLAPLSSRCISWTETSFKMLRLISRFDSRRHNNREMRRASSLAFFLVPDCNICFLFLDRQFLGFSEHNTTSIIHTTLDAVVRLDSCSHMSVPTTSFKEITQVEKNGKLWLVGEQCVVCFDSWPSHGLNLWLYNHLFWNSVRLKDPVCGI